MAQYVLRVLGRSDEEAERTVERMRHEGRAEPATAG
jgi:hypothetical protein